MGARMGVHMCLMRVYVYKFYSVLYFSLVKSWTDLHRLENSLRHVLLT